MKNFSPLLILFFITASACGTSGEAAKSEMAAKRLVPIAITIESPKTSDLNAINTNNYRSRLLCKLEDFQKVKFVLVEADNNPEITINLNISNFMVLPRYKQANREVLTRSVQLGTDTSGKPVYEKATATVDFVSIQQSSNARMVVYLQIKGARGKTYTRSFTPRYNYKVNYVENVLGDSRAIDPSLYFTRSPISEPNKTDFLVNLSGDMLARVATQVRSYYRQ